jgi:hypothetical protein
MRPVDRVPKANPLHRARNAEGQALVEWVLLLCLISILGIAVLATFGQNTAALVSRVGRDVTLTDSSAVAATGTTAAAQARPFASSTSTAEPATPAGQTHSPTLTHRALDQLRAGWTQARQLANGGDRLQLPVLLVLLAILAMALLSVVVGVVRGVLAKVARDSVFENETTLKARFEESTADLEAH